MKVRVPVYGTVGKAVVIDTERGVSQEQLDAALAAQRAEILSTVNANAGSSSSTPGLATTLWRLIREVPPNILKVAALATNGLVTRQVSGEWVVRSIAVADTGRLTVANADGDGGNPTLDMADVSSVSVWGRATNSAGKPAAIQAAENDRVLARVADQLAFQQLTVGMAPDSLWTYDKLQQVSAESKLLGRGAGNGAGDIQEITLGTGLSMSGTTLNATGGSGGGGNVTPDTHPDTPDAADDEFEDGSALDTTGARRPGATPWVFVAKGSMVDSVVNGHLVLSCVSGGASDSWKLALQPISGAGKWRAPIYPIAPANFATGGLVIYNEVNGRLIALAKTNNSGPRHFVGRYSSLTSFTSSLLAPTDNSVTFGPIIGKTYMEIEYTGTALVFSLSQSGVEGTFIPIATESAATFLGTPTHIGYGLNPNTTATTIVSDWFRRVT